MDLREKLQFVATQSNASVDAHFQLVPVTDVPHEGNGELYLQGLTPEALFTSYRDVLAAMEWLRGQGVRSWCDVGCGVGRTVLLWSWLYPDSTGIGVELVPERLEAARGAGLAGGLSNTRWIEGDFASPGLALPEADAYFIYLSTGPALDALLEKIKKRGRPAWVLVIESHGDLKPRLQWESWWLAPHAQRFALVSYRHDPWLSLYRVHTEHPGLALERSWEGRTGLLPPELGQHPSPLGYLLTKSFQRHWEVVILEHGEQWTMDTLGLRWHAPQELQGQFPPRQFSWRVDSVGLRHAPQSGEYANFSQWRREQTPLSYATLQGEKAQGQLLRKIYVAPQIRLEFSNGRQIPVNELSFLRPTE